MSVYTCLGDMSLGMVPRSQHHTEAGMCSCQGCGEQTYTKVQEHKTSMACCGASSSWRMELAEGPLSLLPPNPLCITGRAAAKRKGG